MVLESGGHDAPVNRSGAAGLLQIVPEVWPELCAAVRRAHDVPNVIASWRLLEINSSRIAWSPCSAQWPLAGLRRVISPPQSPAPRSGH